MLQKTLTKPCSASQSRRGALLSSQNFERTTPVQQPAFKRACFFKNRFLGNNYVASILLVSPALNEPTQSEEAYQGTQQ